MPINIRDHLNQTLWADVKDESSFPAKRPLLAHYTSVQVLEKVLINNEMWFSNPLYMNDWEELQYGMNSGAREFRSSDHLINALDSKESHTKLVAYFDQLFHDFDTNHAIDTYVLCFTEHEAADNDGTLSMWRGYGERGSGVAMVIDTAKFGSITDSPLILSNVHYASQAQRLDWIDKKLAQLAQILRAYPASNENLYYAAHAWIERLKIFSLFTKHDGFREEREWRVVYMNERDDGKKLAGMLSYLITPRGVEPKLKLRLGDLPSAVSQAISIESITNRIILGPSLSTVLAANSVRKMLSLMGKDALTDRVVESSIPFRP